MKWIRYLIDSSSEVLAQVRVRCRVRFSVRISFTVRVSVRVIQELGYSNSIATHCVCEATQFHKHGVTNNGQNASSSTDEKVIKIVDKYVFLASDGNRTKKKERHHL